MAVSGKDRRGLVEELRVLRTRLDRLERRNTELMRAEHELRETLEQLKTVFDNSPVGLYRTTPDGRILMANSAIVNMLGYRSFDELARRNLENEGYEPKYPRSDFKERMEREGKVLGLESAWKRSDGTTLYVRESAQAVRDESGHTLYYQGTVEDITEHRQTQKALQASEEMLGALTATLSEGVSVVDENLRYVLANRASEEIFGVEPGGMVGRSLGEFVSGRNRAIVEEQLSRRRQGIAASYDLEIIRPDGQKRQLIVTAAPRLSEDGKYMGSLAVFFDVTEKKQAEEALRKAHDELEVRVQERTTELRQANEALQAEIADRVKADRVISERARIIDSTTDAVIKTDAGGLVTLWNSGAERIFGYTSEEMTGQPISILYREQDRGRLDEIIRDLLRGEEIPTAEVTCVHKDGSLVELALSLFPLKDYVGNVTEFVGISKDITDYKRARDALRESEKRYKAVIENAGEGIAVTQDGVPQLVNPRMAAITGYSQEQMVSRPFIEFVHADDRERVMHFYTRRLQGREVPAVYEFRIIDHQGNTKWIENNGALIEWKGRAATLNFLRDITERKQTERTLRETTELLETIFAHTHILVACLDPQFNFVRVNRAYAQADGREPSFFVGRNHFELYPNAENEAIFRKVVQIGVPYFAHAKPFEYAEHPERGVTCWDWSLVPIKQQDGAVSGLVLTLVNVTEQKRAEQALQQSEEKFRTMFELSPYATVFSDLDGRIQACNQQFCKMHGTQDRPEAQVGRNVAEFFLEEERAALRSRMDKTIEERKSQGLFEYMMLREDGTTFPAEACSTILADRNGTPQGLLALAHDITERRAAERALRDSEERFRQFFENEPEYCYMVSPEGIVLDVNAAALKALAWSKDELVGRPLGVIYAPESQTKAAALFEQWQRGNAIENEELIICTKDGTHRTVLLSSGFIRNAGGQILHSVSVQRDVTELKQAERALREREVTLTSIFRAAPVGIGLECDRVLARVNDQICAMLGYSREELVQQNAKMFYASEEDYQRAREEKRRQISQKGRATVETRWKRRDGRVIDVLLSATVLDPADFAKGLTFTALDITDRKGAEESLRESEEKFRSLAEQSPNMIFINKGGRVVYANKKCEQIMGYTREALYSPDFDFLSLIAPESLDLIRGNFARHLSGREIEPYDYCLISKAGERIEAINASKLIQYEGETAILGIVTDITERKRAEQALRESQERLAILFESAPDAIYMTDLEGRFIDGNKMAEELVGFTKAELVGRNLAESLMPSAEDRSKAAANVRKVASGQPSGPTEYTIRKKSGSIIAVEVRTFPVTIGDKTLSLGIARDITDRKKTQQRLLEDREQLKSLASQLSLTEERERHRLATILHDQIGQSLVISKTKLDQLRKSGTTGGLTEAMSEISRSIGQMIQQTRTLTFDLSYPILYELGFEAAVAEWLTEEIQEKHGIETEFHDDGQVKPLDEDIQAMLFRNVRELLINVVKHAKAQLVKVSVANAEKYICVSVQDDGVGFDPADVAATAAKRAEFGLFSIRERLEQLGGCIEIDSQPGRGTRVTMTAPLRFEPVSDGRQK